MLDQYAREAEQREHDDALAKEQAREATRRKQKASDTLKEVRAQELEAAMAVAELQQALSRNPSEDSDKED